MANRGRVYERLFERDFGFRAPAAFIYLPRFYRTNPGLLTPFSGIVLKNQIFKSDEGLANYTDGVVSWDVPLPGTTTPNMAIRIEYQLTFDEDFATARLFLRQNGVDILWIEDLPPLTNLPTMVFSSPVTYLPPFSRPPTSWNVAATAAPWNT